MRKKRVRPCDCKRARKRKGHGPNSPQFDAEKSIKQARFKLRNLLHECCMKRECGLSVVVDRNPKILKLALNPAFFAGIENDGCKHTKQPEQRLGWPHNEME